MNYIHQINAFHAWLETNHLSYPGRLLWYVLMHVANGTGWKAVFTVAISTLQVKTGMGKAMIYRARNELRQQGRVEWSQRGGNQSAKYGMVPFAEQKWAGFATQTVTQCATQPATIPRGEQKRGNTPIPPLADGDDVGGDILGVPHRELVQNQQRLEQLERLLRKYGRPVNEATVGKASDLEGEVGFARLEAALDAANDASGDAKMAHWNYVLAVAGGSAAGAAKPGDRNEQGQIYDGRRWVDT